MTPNTRHTPQDTGLRRQDPGHTTENRTQDPLTNCRDDGQGEVKGPCELPLCPCLVWHEFDHVVTQLLEIHSADVVGGFQLVLPIQQNLAVLCLKFRFQSVEDSGAYEQVSEGTNYE